MTATEIAASKLAGRTADELLSDYMTAYATYNAETANVIAGKVSKADDRRPEMALTIEWIETELGRRVELGEFTADEVTTLIDEVAG